MQHTLLFISAITALAIGTASAATVNYSTSFTTADGFVNGAALDGQDTWDAHPGYVISDGAGAGTLNRVNAGGPIHLGTSADVTSELAAGETITMTLQLNFIGSFSNQNNGAWMVGLTSNSAEFPEGATAIGAATFNNNGDNDFYVSASTLNNGTKHDTGIAWDTAYHTLTTTITRSATTNVFDITTDLDGQSTSYTMTHAGLWTGADTAYAGFRFRGNQDGNVDAFSISTGAIPEPSSALLLLSGFGLLVVRRRR